MSVGLTYGQQLILRVSGTPNVSDLEYIYGPDGNRIVKIETPHDGSGNPMDPIYTYYVLDASGNQMAMYKATSTNHNWVTTPLYGSRRLGTYETNVDMLLAAPTPGVEEEYTFETGHKQYELSNHLGNVLATISDRKIAVPVSGASTIDYYVVDYTSFRDYYPFGMEMPGRSYTGSSRYRYGFNGQEKDQQVLSSGSLLTAKYWQYNSCLGVRWNKDPVEKSQYSPYQTFGDNPILFADPEGDDWYKNSETGNIFWANSSRLFLYPGNINVYWVGSSLTIQTASENNMYVEKIHNA